MTTPVEAMLDTVEWTPTNLTGGRDDGLPYATHTGVLEIGGHKLRCYRLNTGQAILHADDVEQFFGVLQDRSENAGGA